MDTSSIPRDDDVYSNIYNHWIVSVCIFLECLLNRGNIEKLLWKQTSRKARIFSFNEGGDDNTEYLINFLKVAEFMRTRTLIPVFLCKDFCILLLQHCLKPISQGFSLRFKTSYLFDILSSIRCLRGKEGDNWPWVMRD